MQRTSVTFLRAFCAAAVAVLMTASAVAQEGDEHADRMREMLRRTQEALRESEAQNAGLTQGKLAAEEKLNAAAAQLAAAQRTAQGAQTALRARIAGSEATQADLTRRLDEVTRELAVMTGKQRETEKTLGQRETTLRQVRQDLDKSVAANTSCEGKNGQLYQYSEALLRQYQKKGVWAALAQKEPVTGIEDVKVQNTVQEYRDKFASQRIAAPGH